MPDLATTIYGVAGLILIYKIGRYVVLGPAPEGPGKDWL